MKNGRHRWEGKRWRKKFRLNEVSSKIIASWQSFSKGLPFLLWLFHDQRRAHFLSPSPLLSSLTERAVFLESKVCLQVRAVPRQWHGKLLSPETIRCCVFLPVTSSQVKVESYSGLLFQRELSARHGNLSWGLWLSGTGCKVHRAQLCAPLFMSFFIFLKGSRLVCSTI